MVIQFGFHISHSHLDFFDHTANSAKIEHSVKRSIGFWKRSFFVALNSVRFGDTWELMKITRAFVMSADGRNRKAGRAVVDQAGGS